MKRTLSLILILTMLLSLAACGSKDAAPTDDGNAPSQEQGGGEEQSRRNDRDADEPEQPSRRSQQSRSRRTTASRSRRSRRTTASPSRSLPGSRKRSLPSSPSRSPSQSRLKSLRRERAQEPPTETPKPETPAEDKPAAAVDDALTILNAIWNTYSDEEKFPAAGGDSEHAVDGAPGSFDASNADSLSYQLTFPADDASLIDSAASLVHMMNLNTFTCGAFHVADANNVARLADDLRTTIQAKHWMCGFPDKLVIVTVGQSVFSVYGNEELVNTFRDKLLASYPTAAAVYDEAINA